jgi:hypothetical protein
MSTPCHKEEIIEELASKLKTQKQLGEETFAMAQSTNQQLVKHREAQQAHEKQLAIFMKNTQEVIDVVNKKLLPVYDIAERNRIADEVIKERAVDWKFWMKFGSACVAFASLVVWFVKQMLK